MNNSQTETEGIVAESPRHKVDARYLTPGTGILTYSGHHAFLEVIRTVEMDRFQEVRVTTESDVHYFDGNEQVEIVQALQVDPHTHYFKDAQKGIIYVSSDFGSVIGWVDKFGKIRTIFNGNMDDFAGTPAQEAAFAHVAHANSVL